MSFWSFGFKAFVKNHSLFANYVGMQRQYNIGYIIPIKKGTQKEKSQQLFHFEILATR